MSDLHRVIGYPIPVGFGLLVLYTAFAIVRDRPPGGLFWNLLAILQVVLVGQAVVGAFLFLSGLRPRSGSWRHYVYGAVVPAIVLVAAHRFAASERFKAIPWLAFGIAAFVALASTLMALLTGLGMI